MPISSPLPRSCAATVTSEHCFGVQTHVANREALRPVTMGLQIIGILRKMYVAQFEWRAEHFDRLIGDARMRRRIEEGVSIPYLVTQWSTLSHQYNIQSPYVWLSRDHEHTRRIIANI